MELRLSGNDPSAADMQAARQAIQASAADMQATIQAAREAIQAHYTVDTPFTRRPPRRAEGALHSRHAGPPRRAEGALDGRHAGRPRGDKGTLDGRP